LKQFLTIEAETITNSKSRYVCPIQNTLQLQILFIDLDNYLKTWSYCCLYIIVFKKALITYYNLSIVLTSEISLISTTAK